MHAETPRHASDLVLESTPGLRLVCTVYVHDVGVHSRARILKEILSVKRDSVTVTNIYFTL